MQDLQIVLPRAQNGGSLMIQCELPSLKTSGLADRWYSFGLSIVYGSEIWDNMNEARTQAEEQADDLKLKQTAKDSGL
jgi:hypothetical protein